MKRIIEDKAEELGISDPSGLAIFLSERAFGSHNSEIAPKIGVSERTLHNWTERLIDLERTEFKDLLIASIEEVEG